MRQIKSIGLLIAGICIFLLAGCCAPTADGIVIKKIYISPHEKIVFIPVFAGEFFITRRKKVFVSECFQITIKEENKNCLCDNTRKICVNKEKYYSLNLGDFYR